MTDTMRCNLPPADRAGRLVSIMSLLARATGYETTPDDGVLFDFPGDDDTARALFDVVLAERQCCPQFRYELWFTPDHTRVKLRLEATYSSLVSDLVRREALLGP